MIDVSGLKVNSSFTLPTLEPAIQQKLLPQNEKCSHSLYITRLSTDLYLLLAQSFSSEVLSFHVRSRRARGGCGSCEATLAYTVR